MRNEKELEKELSNLEKKFKEYRTAESLSESLKLLNLRTRIETLKWVLNA
jgi:hypothetical protein